MITRVRCNRCNDILKVSTKDYIHKCNCNYLSIKLVVNKQGLQSIAVNPSVGDYSLIDDNGNVIITDDINNNDNLDIDINDEGYKQVMMSLDHIIESMQNLSQSGRFSPSLNQDLLGCLEMIRMIEKYRHKVMLQLTQEVGRLEGLVRSVEDYVRLTEKTLEGRSA